MWKRVALDEESKKYVKVVAQHRTGRWDSELNKKVIEVKNSTLSECKAEMFKSKYEKYYYESRRPKDKPYYCFDDEIYLKGISVR